MILKNTNIIIISPEKWGINHLSKHHYTSELSKRGNRVWFVNPPKPPDANETNKISKSLSVITYAPVVRGKNHLPLFLSKWLHKIEINRIVKITGKPDIVWSFDPFRFQWLKDFEASLSIYHPVDMHPSATRQNIISSNAGFIFAPANKLLDDINGFNAKKHFVPHGCHHSRDNISEKSITLPGKNKIKACYIGNLYKVLDLDFILKLATKNTDVDFVFVGPTKNSNLGYVEYKEDVFNSLRARTNCFFVGEVNPGDLISYLNSADINFVTYKEVQLNPHKLMAYFYSGKVVLTTPLEEYKNSSLLEVASPGNDFLVLFDKVKNNLSYYNSVEKQKERRDFAVKHSYSNLIDKIEEIINE